MAHREIAGAAPATVDGTAGRYLDSCLFRCRGKKDNFITIPPPGGTGRHEERLPVSLSVTLRSRG
jgi:hypothetical protein